LSTYHFAFYWFECLDFTIIRQSKRREVLADGIGDVVGAEMGVMLLCHARIGVAQLLCDDWQGDALHGQQTAMGVAQDVKRDGWADLCIFACLDQWLALV
jgi:hypothetical protein